MDNSSDDKYEKYRDHDEDAPFTVLQTHLNLFINAKQSEITAHSEGDRLSHWLNFCVLTLGQHSLDHWLILVCY